MWHPQATIVLLVRNPLSNYDGWRRYLAETRRQESAASSLTSFGRLWGAHVRFWVMRATTTCTKLYEVRYEDIVDAQACSLSATLQPRSPIPWRLQPTPLPSKTDRRPSCTVFCKEPACSRSWGCAPGRVDHHVG